MNGALFIRFLKKHIEINHIEVASGFHICKMVEACFAVSRQQVQKYERKRLGIEKGGWTVILTLTD